MRNKKLTIFVVGLNLFLVGMLIAAGGIAARAVGLQVQSAPQTISYQGFLADETGNPVDEARDMAFRIFEAETGTTPLWQESHPGVEVSAGDFSVQLGEFTLFPESLFESPERWLEIEVEGVILSPRQRFTSVPYALNADKLDGHDASDLMGGGLPSGAIVSFPEGSSPAGFTLVENALGQDVGAWNSIAASPSYGEPYDSILCDVWTGSEVLCLSSNPDVDPENTKEPFGLIYNAAADSWRSMSMVNVPGCGSGRSSIWTGTEMIVWGGTDTLIPWGLSTNAGARYNPATDTWIPISTSTAPEGHREHGAVWTGSEMIIWGGYTGPGPDNHGARYNPASDTWTPVSSVGAPEARVNHVMVWTGSEVIVWGGQGWLENGAIYNPATDSWRPINTAGSAPVLGNYSQGMQGAVWTGSEMAFPNGNQLFFFNPTTNSWRHSVNLSFFTRPDGRLGWPIALAGDKIITQSSIYDLTQGKAVAPIPLTMWTYAHWTGDRVLFLDVPYEPANINGIFHTIELVYPFRKE